MPHAHFGIVDDGGQHVVEFVRGGADQFAQCSQLLHLLQLLFEEIDLLLGSQRGMAVRLCHGIRFAPVPAC